MAARLAIMCTVATDPMRVLIYCPFLSWSESNSNATGSIVNSYAIHRAGGIRETRDVCTARKGDTTMAAGSSNGDNGGKGV